MSTLFATPLPSPWQMLPASCLVAISLSDLLDRRISNRLCQVVLLAGLCAGLRHGLGGAVDAALGSVAALALGLGPFLGRWLGGGDVKAFAALGAFLGASAAVRAALVASLLGGLTALAVVAVAYSSPEASVPGRPPLTVPYALAICGGCAWALWVPAVF